MHSHHPPNKYAHVFEARRTGALEHVVFSSYGNDSIALIQWMIENGGTNTVVVYSDTGWARPDWLARVAQGEAFAEAAGMLTVRLGSVGMEQLVRIRKGWPRNGMQFCTSELKIKPAQLWLRSVDPDCELVCCVGVRREESPSRARWPEYTPDSDAHGGRELWAPLVRVLEGERNELIARSGMGEPLEHRSKECYPCVNANRTDLRTLTPERVNEIEDIENSLGVTSKGKPRTMFRPAKKKGAVGIREVKKWADSDWGKYEPPSGCDSGMCGI